MPQVSDGTKFAGGDEPLAHPRSRFPASRGDSQGHGRQRVDIALDVPPDSPVSSILEKFTSGAVKTVHKVTIDHGKRPPTTGAAGTIRSETVTAPGCGRDVSSLDSLAQLRQAAPSPRTEASHEDRWNTR
jgi:hypothetical protein